MPREGVRRAGFGDGGANVLTRIPSETAWAFGHIQETIQNQEGKETSKPGFKTLRGLPMDSNDVCGDTLLCIALAPQVRLMQNRIGGGPVKSASSLARSFLISQYLLERASSVRGAPQ